MSSATSNYEENMYCTSFFDKNYHDSNWPHYPTWPPAAILDLKMQLVSLKNCVLRSWETQKTKSNVSII